MCFSWNQIFFACTLRIHGFTLVALSMHVIQKWMVLVNMFKDMVFDNLEVRDCTEQRFHPPPFFKRKKPRFANVGWSADHLRDFADALPLFTNLRSLNLNGNKFGDEGARIVADMLQAPLSCASSRLSDVAVPLTNVCKESLSLI